jgi:DNA-3-methyladenine glycosylase II
MTTIKNTADLERGMIHLAQVEPQFASAYEETGPLPLRLRPEGFATLLDAIISQQLSVASASSIKKKMKSIAAFEPENLGTLSDEDLRAAGMSAQKTRYARALAEANLPYEQFRRMSDAEVISALTAVLGIGQWTADIYLKFALGRADAFACGDLALQESAKILLGLEKRPTAKALETLAEKWRPWRSVAARLLWSYYHIAKEREGI